MMRCLITAVILCGLCGCSLIGPPFPPRVQIADSYVSFTLFGRTVTVEDWTGGEAMAPSMWARYNAFDSTIVISAWTGDTMVTFLARIPSQEQNEMWPDTTDIVLNVPSLPFYRDTIDATYPGLVGNAMLRIGDSLWSTDSLHVGTFQVRSLEQSTGYMNASFNFSAKDTLISGPSNLVNVANGIIHRMPIYQ